MTFEFNERAIKKAVHDGVAGMTKEYERMFERLSRQYKGKPDSLIKPVLRLEWRKIAGGDITDPELSQYAEAICNGTRIKLTVA